MASHLLSVAQHDTSLPRERPHVVLIIPRGEAARNFIYSGTLPALAERAKVTVLAVLDDEGFRKVCEPHAASVLPLPVAPEHRLLRALRAFTHLAHFQKLSSAVARETLARRLETAPNRVVAARRAFVNSVAGLFANEPALGALDSLEEWASWRLRSGDGFLDLFRQLEPSVVFNGSHIHGPAAIEPVNIAHRMKIPTATFIFSWDNLTSRGRILGHYDHYFTWHEPMRQQLLSIYPRLRPEQVVVTGTPQFDFHYQPRYFLDRVELCRRIGADPARPFVLYTTGMDTHFPEEYRTVELVARILDRLPLNPKPQLVVRTYIKGTSVEMKALRARNLPGVIFPEVLWEPKWLTPLPADLCIYSSMLKHCAFGINAASTVSLELLMHNKPVINLGFDPPGSSLPHSWRFQRHLEFDHYKPVVASGAVMVAGSDSEMEPLIQRAFSQPGELEGQRRAFVEQTFGNTLDGRSGERTAEALLTICGCHQEK
jgi:hypothetical protein